MTAHAPHSPLRSEAAKLKPPVRNGQSICWLPVVLGGCVLVLALAVVWLNIERMYLAYELRQLQTEVERETELQARLEVERMNLLSSARLRLLAEESGLRPAGPGQIRILVSP